MSCRVYNAASSPRVTQVCDMSLVKGGAVWWQLLRPYIIHISQLIIYTNWHAQGGAPCAMYHNRLVAQINIVGIVTTSLCIWIFHASPNLVLANIPLQRVWHISHWICCCCAFHLTNVSISVAALWQTDRKSIFNKWWIFNKTNFDISLQ